MALIFPIPDLFSRFPIQTSSFALNFRQTFSRDGAGRLTTIDYRNPYWEAAFVTATMNEDDCLAFPRDFLEITVRDRATGAPVVERLWSDRFDISAPVLRIETGAVETLTWQGASGLVETSDLVFVSNLTVAEATITMSAYGVDVDRLMRLYDPSRGPVRLYRGFLNVNTGALVAPAEQIYQGEIDFVELPTGADGEESYLTMTVLASQELTLANTETRSDASQRLRNPVDRFFEYAAQVSEWTIWWGQNKGKVEAETSKDRANAAAQRLRSIQ